MSYHSDSLLSEQCPLQLALLCACQVSHLPLLDRSICSEWVSSLICSFVRLLSHKHIHWGVIKITSM
jgi:hypothetical protein